MQNQNQIFRISILMILIMIILAWQLNLKCLNNIRDFQNVMFAKTKDIFLSLTVMWLSLLGSIIMCAIHVCVFVVVQCHTDWSG